ncbi:PEGA domain-containing protein, partial [Candidatus Peregrinibacteria bacterium]|nr:PEGA domain-containing protein [Candidatus Peregrinibacteria bacterium]
MVLFLANGYQYDFISQEIRRTGLIDITFADKEAKVRLDGEELEGKLPFVASNVLPGKYELTVIRDGFQNWQETIEVEPDKITKVANAFLYPEDERSLSRLIWIDELADQHNYYLSNDYLFINAAERLYFSKIADLEDRLPLDAMQSLFIGSRQIAEVNAYDDYIQLDYLDGSKEVRRLDPGIVQGKEISSHMAYAGDKWLYFDRDLLAFFDLDLEKVMQAKKIEGVKEIREIKDVKLFGKEYLLIFDKDNEGARLYRLENGNLVFLAEGVKTILPFKDAEYLLLEKINHELWYLESPKKQTLLKRMAGDFELMAFDLTQYKTRNLLLLKANGKYLLTDLNMQNVRQIYADRKVLDLNSANNQIYALIAEEAEAGRKVRLYQL